MSEKEAVSPKVAKEIKRLESEHKPVVYINASDRDRDAAERFAAQLRKAGLSYVFSPRKNLLLPGQQEELEMSKLIKRCTHFIDFRSDAEVANRSENQISLRYAKWAREMGKGGLNGEFIYVVTTSQKSKSVVERGAKMMDNTPVHCWTGDDEKGQLALIDDMKKYACHLDVDTYRELEEMVDEHKRLSTRSTEGPVFDEKPPQAAQPWHSRLVEALGLAGDAPRSGVITHEAPIAPRSSAITEAESRQNMKEIAAICDILARNNISILINAAGEKDSISDANHARQIAKLLANYRVKVGIASTLSERQSETEELDKYTFFLDLKSFDRERLVEGMHNRVASRVLDWINDLMSDESTRYFPIMWTVEEKDAITGKRWQKGSKYYATVVGDSRGMLQLLKGVLYAAQQRGQISE